MVSKRQYFSGTYSNVFQYDAAIKDLLAIQPFISKQNNNRFLHLHWKFRVFSHQHDFENAEKTLREAFQDPRLHETMSHLLQVWKLNEFYLQYAKLQVGDETMANELLKKLVLFKREVASLRNDKEGYNFALFLIEQLLLLATHNDKSIDQELRAMRYYRKRYLRREPDARVLTDFILACLEATNGKQINEEKLRSSLEVMKRDLKALRMISGIQVLDYFWIGSRVLSDTLITGNLPKQLKDPQIRAVKKQR